jgi:hypothetical protein
LNPDSIRFRTWAAACHDLLLVTPSCDLNLESLRLSVMLEIFMSNAAAIVFCVAMSAAQHHSRIAAFTFIQ